MEYKILGKTGLKISALGFGGIPIQRIDAQGTKELMTPDGEKFVLQDMFSKDAFTSITSQIADPENAEKKITNPDYTNYVAPARQAYAADATKDNAVPLIAFVVLLLVVFVWGYKELFWKN